MKSMPSALWLACVTVGCAAPMAPPTGQVLIWVTTDAPLPELQPRHDSLPALFDRLQIDLYAPISAGTCVDSAASCEPKWSRQLALDGTQFGRYGMSFGVALPPEVTGYRVRTRLYRAALANGNMPPARDVIDYLASLPAVPIEGEPVTISIVLGVDTVGNAAEHANPKTPTFGLPPPDLVGTWPGAKRVACAGAARNGEVCVPGGAFWMGVLDRIETPTAPDVPSVRLVQLSPFFMDSNEVTVQAMRDFGQVQPTNPLDPRGPADPVPWVDNPKSVFYYATWAPDDVAGWPFAAPPGAMSVSAVSKQLAIDYCQAKGGTLPSEAQFEYVSGGLANRTFIWGNDDPSCEDAVWGRAGVGILTAFWGDCLGPGDVIGGPLPPNSGRRDVLALDGGSIYDIAGGLLEWTADDWNRQDQRCWDFNLRTDPVCRSTILGQAIYSLRGGGWPLVAAAMRSQSRLGMDPASVSKYSSVIGFRCVRRGS